MSTEDRTVLDRLIRIEVLIETKLNDVVKELQDHEARIRANERWRWALPVSAILFAASLAVGIFNALGR